MGKWTQKHLPDDPDKRIAELQRRNRWLESRKRAAERQLAASLVLQGRESERADKMEALAKSPREAIAAAVRAKEEAEKRLDAVREALRRITHMESAEAMRELAMVAWRATDAPQVSTSDNSTS